MKPFMDEEFLLDTDAARRLYHTYAEPMPIADYHCHIDAREIFEDRRFENLTQAWLGGDHYKWRLMRAGGAPEELVTGNGGDWEKFQKWVLTCFSLSLHLSFLFTLFLFYHSLDIFSILTV